MDVLDVGKNIRRRDQLCPTMRRDNLVHDPTPEESHDGGDAPVVREVRDVCRLDPQDTATPLLEVGEERAIVGADVDDEVLGTQAEKRRRLSLKLGEVLAQD